jgi:hypothetical protein
MSILRYAIAFFLLSIGAFLLQSTGMFQQTTVSQGQADKGIDFLRSEVQAAKAAGRNEIVLPPVNESLIAVRSIADILQDYSLLRVKVKDIETTISDPSIDTWYKLELLEIIHKQGKIGDAQLPESVPDHFLPQLSSECLMVRPGGAVNLDGVRVVRALGEHQFALTWNKEYLVAAYLDCAGKLIRPVAQADGVFVISNSKLIPLAQKNREIVREIEFLYGNSLDTLRTEVRHRREQEK